MKIDSNSLKIFSNNLLFLVAGLVLITSALLPLAFSRDASALQLSSRSLTLGTARTGQTTTYTYGFTVPTAGDINSVKFEACTTAVGSCVAPTGLNIDAGTEASRTGWVNANAFSRDADGGGTCDNSVGNNILCITRTDGAAEDAVAKTLGWNTQINPTTANSTFFIRITTFSDVAFATSVDTGTVASAVTQTLTIDAQVAEILSFCVGATTVNDADSLIWADCSSASGTNVNLGVLDTGFVNVSPVAAASGGGDNENGVAMVRSNAANGTTVNYYAVQQSGTNHLGTLRVSGASCNAGLVLTDQCINAVGTDDDTIAAGAEEFGMTIAAVNCGSNGDVAYNCDFGTVGAHNLTRDTDYDGDGTISETTNFNDSGQEVGTTTSSYAWQEGTAIEQIASSAASTIKPIEDEALLMKFAATPSITTPTGSYTALIDLVAVATY